VTRDSILRRPPSPPASSASRRIAGETVGAIVALLAIVAVAQAAAPPPTVDRIAFVNPTAYDLSIDVTSARRDGWMPVVLASRHRATVIREVVDHGDTWIFRVEAQGEDGGELVVSRRELERNHWVVSVPDEIASRLEAGGATPPP
jgi:hypothetical protein